MQGKPRFGMDEKDWPADLQQAGGEIADMMAAAMVLNCKANNLEPWQMLHVQCDATAILVSMTLKPDAIDKGIKDLLTGLESMIRQRFLTVGATTTEWAMASPNQPPLEPATVIKLRAQPVLTSAECATLLRVSLQRFLDQRERLYREANFPKPLTGMGRRGLKWSGAMVFRWLDAEPATPVGEAIASDADDDAAALRARERQQKAAQLAQGRAA